MADDKLQYIPNTILPDDPDAMMTYLKEELDKIAFTFNNIDLVTEDIDPNDFTLDILLTAEHNALQNRDVPNTHPQASITGLVEGQAEQDLAIAQKATVFFQPNQPTDEESSQGDFWFVSGYD